MSDARQTRPGRPNARIRTREDLAAWAAADAAMNGVERWRPRHALTRGVVHFLHVLRLCEYWENRPGPVARVVSGVYKVRLRRLSERLGFDVGRHTAGPGLSIAHSGLLVIHPDARIGARCRIHQGVTIGATAGGVPVIGDDVFIGVNSTVLGPIKIGDRVRIGANTCVTTDVPSDSIVIGSPAKIYPRLAPFGNPSKPSRRRRNKNASKPADEKDA